MTDDDQPPRPFYGIDDQTDEQYFGPCSQEEAISARDVHPRREHIELKRYPAAR